MGPTLEARLPSRGALSKAVCKMTDFQRAKAPARCDDGEGLKDEVSFGEASVGNIQFA